MPETSKTIHAITQLEAMISNVQATPDAVVIVDCEGTRHTTYQQFLELVNFYAYHLKQEYGLHAGDVVALRLGRCMEHFAMRISCAFAGFVFVSVNPDYPAEHATQTIEQAHVKLVIDDELLATMEIARGAALHEEIPSQLDTAIDDSAPYYIVSTSGTTGKPKLILHDRSVFELMSIVTHDFGFDTYAVQYAAMADMMFVMSIIEMLFFSSGDTLHIISSNMRTDISGLHAYFEHEAINATSTLPALLAAIMPMPSLKAAFVAGESSNIDLNSFGIKVLNFYGASEAPGMAFGAANGAGALEQSFTHTRIWLADENGQTIPQSAHDITGEVCFSGPGIMSAYLGDLEATTNHISQDETSPYRTYYTGDAAHYNNAGAIVLTGRLDSMVKVRGQRVDIAGVERILSKINGIAECAVVARTSAAGKPVIVAFYVARKKQSLPTLNEETLRTALADKLPGYAIPSYFISVETFKRTTSGKIDRTQLQLPDVAHWHAPYAAPKNALQEKIVAAFENVLDLDHIGINDDFIRMGGDSLKAMRVSAALGQMGLAITTADILRLHTPQAISNIEGIAATQQPQLFSADDALPLTEPQLNVYLDMQTKDKLDAYLITESMDIPAGYTCNQVQEALRELCNAHPILCRKITEIDGTPYLVSGLQPHINIIANTDDVFAQARQPLNINQTLARFCIEDTQNGLRLHATIHHLVFDGTSWIIFKRKLLQVLSGNSLQQDNAYLHAASLAATIEQHSKLKEAKNFFDDMLAPVDEAEPLLPDVATQLPGKRTRTLSIDASQINEWCAQTGVSASALFTSVFAYTLSRFTSSSKVLFNILDNGRDACQAHDALGMFVTTCPILIDCKADDAPTFVQQCARNLYQATTYGFYPYRLLAAEHSIDASMLFQYRPDLDADSTEGTCSYWETDEDFPAETVPETDFGFHVTQAGATFQAALTYSTRYCPKTAQRFLFAYDAILAGILEEKPLDVITYTSSEDIGFQNHINKTETAVAQEDVLDAFAASLAKHPDHTLVTYQDKTYSYAQGAAITMLIAEALLKAGIRPHANVAILVPRSEWYLLAALAALTAGCTYVPLDDAYPDERLAFMLRDTSAAAVLITSATANRVMNLLESIESVVPTIDIESLRSPAHTTGPQQFSYHTPNPDDTACILYTSGTTGTPKGVLATRRALNNYTAWFANRFDVGPNDCMCMYRSFGFDSGNTALFIALRKGGCLDVLPEDCRLDPERFREHALSQRLSICGGMPGTFIRICLENGGLSTFRVIITGGERFGETDEKTPDLLFDGYGPTESLDAVCTVQMNDRIHPSSVGNLLPNIKAYILDSDLRRVPAGAVGQLYLSGHQLAKEYLNRSKETEAAFLPNPFDGDEPGYERIYATGDMVRILPDCTIGFIGRRDSQVKIRGNRVECGEVEACIRQLSCVSDVTVQPIDTSGAYELCAYVATDGNMDKNELRELVTTHVAAAKPSYMVPAFVVALDAIPLTVNGKVDKRALPKLDLSALQVSFVAAQSAAEYLVVRAFEEVLGISPIGINDDFLRLGGDSIKAIKVVSLLRKSNATCQAKDILQLQTPARIADVLEEAQSAPLYTHLQGPIPLLPIQSRFFEEVDSNSYVQIHLVRATEAIDTKLLGSALGILCDTHDMLRATYQRTQDGSITQIVQPQSICSLTLECVRISALDHNEIQDGIQPNKLFTALQADIESLDPYAGHLGQVVLCSTPTDDYLAFAIHHLVIDGVSWSILLDDLADIYRSLKAGQEPQHACPYPYGTWAERVQSYALAMDEPEKRYWQRIHSLLETSNAAVMTAHVDESMVISESFTFTLPSAFDASNIYDLREQDYLLCATARAYRTTFGVDAVFDMESFGRDIALAKTDRTIGWFTTRYPLHLPQCAGNTTTDILRDIIAVKQALASVPHMGIGYGALVYGTHEINNINAPLAFNYLADEFSHSNALFESIAPTQDGQNNQSHWIEQGLIFGTAAEVSAKNSNPSNNLTLNILKTHEGYLATGSVAGHTVLHERLSAFVKELERQLRLVADALAEVRQKGNAVYPLAGNQLGFYLDDLAHDKAKAFLATRRFPMPGNMDENDACRLARMLICNHPILASRIEAGNQEPLGICDAPLEPQLITVANQADEQRLWDNLNAPFDTTQALARIFVVKRVLANTHAPSFELAICLHHMISDTFSFDLLGKEVYSHALRDEQRDWGFLHTALTDCAYRLSTDHAQDRAFFANYLADVSSIDSAPPRTGDGTAGRAAIRIPKLCQAQHNFIEKLGITEHGLFLSAFAYTLALFSTSENVCFTFTEHGRRTDEEQNAVGMYVRSFPVAIDCKNCATAAFLTRAFASSMDAMQHSTYPFFELIRDFGISNEITFESNTVFDSQVPEPEQDIVWDELVDGLSGIANFECVLLRSACGYVFAITHTGDYSKECALSFAQTYRAVLANIASSETLHDIQLGAAQAQEAQQALANINKHAALVQHPDIVDVFDNQVTLTPEATCLRDQQCALTYSQADALSDAIAAALSQQGIIQQNRVALLTGRNLFFTASMLACLKADITYIPIDEDQPAPRIARMMELADCNIILATADTHSLAQDAVALVTYATILCLDNEFMQRALKHPQHFVRAIPTPESHNCILFTSGTTGDPKGIVNKRVTQSNLAQAIAHVGSMTAQDVYGLYASFGYSPHLDSLSALAVGASIDIIPQHIRLDMVALNGYLNTHAITHTFLSSSIAYRLFSQANPATLKVAFRGGEPVKNFTNQTACHIFDEFGCTECSNIFQIDASTKQRENELGYPIDNTHVYLLDSYGRPALLGAAGRLFISGAQLAECVLAHDVGDESQHANNFVANTQENTTPFERMYPTGDIACIHDGRLLHLGRTDGVIKIRGNRVELGDVESCLRAHAGIADAVVRVAKAQGSQELVAYVVPTSSARTDAARTQAFIETLRAHVAATKPAFMAPTYYVVLDSIPLNAHGKVDTRALPAPDATKLRAPYVAPRNDIEAAILSAFQEVLGNSELGIDDNFIHMGGDSLKAIRATAILENYGISGADILKLQTARAIAELTQTRMDENANQSIPSQSEQTDVMQQAQDLFNEYLGI